MAKKARDNSKVEQQDRNTLELSAWNEWKEVCRILGCSPAHRESLKSRMWTSAQTKLKYLLEMSIPKWHEEYSEEGWKDEISARFDKYIKEGVDDITGRRLNYKDCIWHLINENCGNGDAEISLRVIRGKLTAPRRVLDSVLEKLVREKGWAIDVKGHVTISPTSLNVKTSIEGEGECQREMADLLPAPVQFRVSAEDRALIAKTLQDEFSFVECVLLMAHFKEVSFADVAVGNACGFGKSTASYKFFGREDPRTGKKIPGVRDKFKMTMAFLCNVAGHANEWSEIKDIVMMVLKQKIKLEKRGVQFLSAIGVD